MTKADQSVSLFGSGLNCAQSVLAAFAEDFGLSREIALKLACGFGGGMCHLGQTCGAVTGAFLALGLGHGWVDPKNKDHRTRVSNMINECADRFCAKHKSLRCFELLGCDLRTEEGRATFKAKDLRKTLCEVFVRDAAEIVETVIR